MSAFAATLITTETIVELSPRLFHVALRSVRRREDAEDLVQETWFSALRTVSTFEGRSSLRSWLTSILRRRIADRFRAERPALPLNEEEHLSPWRPSTEQHDWEEASAFVARSLSDLTTLERAAITLCDIEDLDRDEAAVRLRIKRGYLRVLLHRARAKLQLSLRREGVGAFEEAVSLTARCDKPQSRRARRETSWPQARSGPLLALRSGSPTS